MTQSAEDEVVRLYEPTADSYSSMMNSEIQSPVYFETLSRLHGKLAQVPGPLVDISCGSGHMLSLYAEKFTDNRKLIGVDITPRMVELANERLGSAGKARVGDMRCVSEIDDGSVAALLNFFAIHHVTKIDLIAALGEWHRLLRSGGQLVMAAWEGVGRIDYGDDSELIAYKYSESELRKLLTENGFSVDRCLVETIEEMSMEAIYIDATCKK
jgi:ubiquinone/menaquinone biosynthesis C-methylase UbiE